MRSCLLSPDEKKLYTLMINNSTNINKMNNHLSPQLGMKKKIQHDVGYPALGLGQAQHL
jgi:hypothetical protein